MIAASEGANDAHLEALSRLSTFLMDKTFRNRIIEADSKEEILQAVNEIETAVDFPEDNGEEDLRNQNILAVTACSTGIAHTYMAAEKLTETAKDMGLSIKVETNGSGGVKNRLTEKEIKEAGVIVVAADTQVKRCMKRRN